MEIPTIDQFHPDTQDFNETYFLNTDSWKSIWEFLHILGELNIIRY